MKKLLTSLVLVLVLCLACSIAFAAEEDAAVNGKSYETITLSLHGDGDVWEQWNIYYDMVDMTDAELSAAYPGYLWIKRPTCTTTGQIQVPCQIEDGRYHTIAVDKVAHKNEVKYDFVKCTKTTTCTVCGATKTEENHRWSKDYDPLNWGKVTEKYSCTEGGTAQDYCVVCGKTREEYRVIDPLTHDFGEYVIVSYPQCVMGENSEEYKIVDGSAKLVCKRCGAEATEKDVAKKYLTAKIVVNDEDKAELKTADADCPYSLKAADATAMGKKSYPADYHDFDGWVTLKAATCTETGIKTHWCKRCGAAYNGELKALGHDFVARETLVNCFYTRQDYVCSRCAMILNAETYDAIVKDFDTQIAAAGTDYAKAAEIAAQKKAFTTNYKKPTSDESYTAVTSHEYDVKDSYYWIADEDDAAYWGVDYDAVYSGKYSDYQTCTLGEYKAYVCIHFLDGSEGLNGEKHDETHGIHYVKVKDPAGHKWGKWEKVFDPGDGENVSGYYTRQCSVCGAWENRVTPESPVVASTDANNFVLKLFNVLLGETDVSAARVAEWADGLEDGTSTAADVVKGIVGSEAFAKKFGSDNEGIVKALYNALLNRNADKNGLNNWTDQLNNGVSMNAVINGFTTSEEFKKFADEAGFEAGELANQSRDVNPRVTAFVERCYTTALGRDGEEGGLNYWTDALLTGAQSPKQVAAGFVFSTEYDAAAKIADEDEVEDVVLDLYWLYLGRGASETEVDWYVDLLNNGMKLEELNTMFADSVEFANIVSSYGLNPNL